MTDEEKTNEETEEEEEVEATDTSVVLFTDSTGPTTMLGQGQINFRLHQNTPTQFKCVTDYVNMGLYNAGVDGDPPYNTIDLSGQADEYHTIEAGRLYRIPPIPGYDAHEFYLQYGWYDFFHIDGTTDGEITSVGGWAADEFIELINNELAFIEAKETLELILMADIQPGYDQTLIMSGARYNLWPLNRETMYRLDLGSDYGHADVYWSEPIMNTIASSRGVTFREVGNAEEFGFIFTGPTNLRLDIYPYDPVPDATVWRPTDSIVQFDPGQYYKISSWPSDGAVTYLINENRTIKYLKSGTWAGSNYTGMTTYGNYFGQWVSDGDYGWFYMPESPQNMRQCIDLRVSTTLSRVILPDIYYRFSLSPDNNVYRITDTDGYINIWVKNGNLFCVSGENADTISTYNISVIDSNVSPWVKTTINYTLSPAMLPLTQTPDDEEFGPLPFPDNKVIDFYQVGLENDFAITPYDPNDYAGYVLISGGAIVENNLYRVSDGRSIFVPVPGSDSQVVCVDGDGLFFGMYVAPQIVFPQTGSWTTDPNVIYDFGELADEYSDVIITSNGPPVDGTIWIQNGSIFIFNLYDPSGSVAYQPEASRPLQIRFTGAYNIMVGV